MNTRITQVTSGSPQNSSRLFLFALPFLFCLFPLRSVSFYSSFRLLKISGFPLLFCPFSIFHHWGILFAQLFLASFFGEMMIRILLIPSLVLPESKRTFSPVFALRSTVGWNRLTRLQIKCKLQQRRHLPDGLMTGTWMKSIWLFFSEVINSEPLPSKQLSFALPS